MYKIISILLLFFPLFSWADSSPSRHETFAHHSEKRAKMVKNIRQRTKKEKEVALKWAAKQGQKTRFLWKGHMVELKAIRNGRPVYFVTKNYHAALSSAAMQTRKSPVFGIDGSNVTVGVWDGYLVRVSHEEFEDHRAVVKDSTGTVGNHATHVAGTIAARGASPFAIGMAPGCHIDSYDWDDDLSEMASVAAASSNQASHIYLSNHSYGIICGWEGGGGNYVWGGTGWSTNAFDASFGQYDDDARALDEITYNAPYFLPFWAAGNDRVDNPQPGDTVRNGYTGQDEVYDPSKHPLGDGLLNGGYDLLDPSASAKNIISVGAVGDAVIGMERSLEHADMTSFSSWGPADDGRIKPDIMANGYELYSSSAASDSSYVRSSGTSMAAPSACGSAALLVDYYSRLFPGEAMRASSLKGLIIHTADDLGRLGPDYQFGWGLMNTLEAAKLLRELPATPSRLIEAKLSIVDTQHIYTFFSEGRSPIRVTLCWTDPPGEKTTIYNSRIPRLVNDLDLCIEDPNGTLHWPYQLDYAHPDAPASTSGRNNIDNVEQVYIPHPVAGSYTITVNYDGILRNSEQYYSLICTTQESDFDTDGLPDYWEEQFFNNPTNASPSLDSDGDGADNLTEFISGYDPTNAASYLSIFLQPVSSNFSFSWGHSVSGRIYRVLWSDDLIYTPFSEISPDLPFPASSFTDKVERTSSENFYQIEVRLDK